MSLRMYFTAAIAIQIAFIHGSAANFPESNIEDLVPDNYRDEYLELGGRNKRAVVFSGVQPEGTAVLNQLNRIMSNASISAESKKKLEEALSNIGKGQRTSSGGGGSKPAPPLRKWSFFPMSVSKSSSQLHATQCCCKVVVPPLTTRKSATRTQWKAFYRRVRSGSRKCGFWGWRRCTNWRDQKYYVSYQTTYYYTVSTPRPCPSDKEVCCRGFIAYKRCCTNIAEMKRLLDLFENQRAQFDSLRAFLISQGHNPDAGCPKYCGP